MKRILSAVMIAVLLLAALPAQAASAQIYYMYENETKDFAELFNGKKVTLSSSNTQVAAVTDGTKVTTSNAGRSVLTARMNGKAKRLGLIVLPSALKLNVGSVYRLPTGSYARCAVRDKGIATVSKGGVVKARNAGETLLAVRTGKKDLFISIEVSGVSEDQSKVASLPCAATAEQIVLVEYTGGSSAVLSLHEKKSGVWKEIYSGKAYVGKNGIGKTKEGDKKTPTGTFNLTTPFGILSDPGAAQSYTKVTQYHHWCGASGTKYYNKLVDSRKTTWNHSAADEHLIDYKGSYDYAMFIDYNAAGEAGKGSCIFLHCKGKNSYTAGCVAVDKSVMKNIIKWAKSGTKIVITERS